MAKMIKLALLVPVLIFVGILYDGITKYLNGVCTSSSFKSFPVDYCGNESLIYLAAMSVVFFFYGKFVRTTFKKM